LYSFKTYDHKLPNAKSLPQKAVALCPKNVTAVVRDNQGTNFHARPMFITKERKQSDYRKRTQPKKAQQMRL